MNYAVAREMQLLRFLIEEQPKLTRTKAKSLLKYGEISVGGKPIKAFDFLLRPGMIVAVGQGTKQVSATSALLSIVYEDDELLVIDKPAGLLSVPDDDTSDPTAFELVSNYLRAKDSKSRAHVVHRLDQYTSGVLLFSKSKHLKQLLQADWNRLVSARKYYAIVEGVPEEAEGTITTWLSPKEGYYVRSSATPRDGSKKAITQYSLLQSAGRYAMLDVTLHTGRKNQIRVHMRNLGHPVAGDKKYHAKTNPLHRLGLHAYRLDLLHPVSGKDMSFTSKMPKSFKLLFKAELKAENPKT